MTEDQARQAILTALAEIAPEVDGASLDPAVPLQDQIDLDSMDFLGLVVRIGELTGVDIPERDYRGSRAWTPRSVTSCAPAQRRGCRALRPPGGTCAPRRRNATTPRGGAGGGHRAVSGADGRGRPRRRARRAPGGARRAVGIRPAPPPSGRPRSPGTRRADADRHEADRLYGRMLTAAL